METKIETSDSQGHSFLRSSLLKKNWSQILSFVHEIPLKQCISMHVYTDDDKKDCINDILEILNKTL